MAQKLWQMLKLSSNKQTDKQTGQKQYAPQFLSGGHKKKSQPSQVVLQELENKVYMKHTICSMTFTANSNSLHAKYFEYQQTFWIKTMSIDKNGRKKTLQALNSVLRVVIPTHCE